MVIVDVSKWGNGYSVRREMRGTHERVGNEDIPTDTLHQPPIDIPQEVV
jgi:hypothetical protein